MSTSKPTRLFAAIMITGCVFFGVQMVSTAQGVETLSGQKSNQPPSRPSVRGPITAISPAALWFATLDKNQDYIITRKEFEAGLKSTFEREDKNSDGKMSLFDLEDWRKRALGSVDAQPHVLQFDNNYNSSITREEFDATMLFMFEAADKNKDDAVAFGEMVAIMDRPRVRTSENSKDDKDLESGKRGQRPPRNR